MSASSEGGAGGAVGGSTGGTATTTAPATLKAVKIRTHPHLNTMHLIAQNTTATKSNAMHMASSSSTQSHVQLRGAIHRYSLPHLPPAAHSTVAAKITHVKTDGGISITGTPIISGGTIKVATAGNTVQTSLSGTPIALNSGQATTAASIRTLASAGPSTQVRVVMPMIKQLENVTATGRTQITAIPAAPARSVSNASITVTRPVTQATYLPRASVTATQMSGVGVTGAQRLVTPLRATSSASVSPAPAGLTSTGNFVRTSQPSTTVISSANTPGATAWMQSNGQVQLIRAIHQPRQRLITTSASVSSASVSTTATPVQAPTAQSMPTQPSGPTGVPQAYVATVLPPRQHQATLVYSSNVSATSAPNTNPNQQFNPRFAVATPIGNATSGASTTPGGTTVTPRQVRPIPLGKSFPATKLNTTSISIRAPSIPQLNSNVAPPTPVSVSGGVSVAGRGPGGSGGAAGVAPVALTAANLPTTRIIQLQQPATGGGQQIIGSTTRLAANVMLQPFLMSTSAAAKMGIRPPVTMTAKVQPSLTITQLNPIGKLSTAGSGPTMTPQGVASIQAVPSVASSVTTSSVSSGSDAAAGAGSTGGSATVLPLTIGGRGGPASNILTGTLTPIKNASGITVGKMMMAQSSGVDAAASSSGLPSSGAGTNVFIQQRSGGGSGVSVTSTASSVATSAAGTSFLPPGSSAIYYESMPASTGVLSLTTTTVTQSTHTHGQAQAQAQQAQAQLVSSSGNSSLSVSSLPFATHAQQVGTGAGSTATFTVLPSSASAGGNRAIGHQQLIIPASAAHATGGPPQHMVIPLHTSVKVTTGAVPTTTGGGATVSALPMQMPVPVGANTLVSNFMRKRDAEGSPIRGVKNLAPTLLSMSSNSNASGSVGNVTAVNLAGGSAFNIQPVSVAPATQPATTTVSGSALTVEALAKKERERVSSVSAAAAAIVGASSASTASVSTTGGSIVSTRNVRADSPASSDGSTTVSANSSPGVDQQMHDSNLSINRIGDEPTGAAVRDNATHFNPINEMYPTHPSNVTHPTLGARGSGIASAFVDVPQQQSSHLAATQAATLTASQLQQARMNGTSGSGSNSEYSVARKKPRRSTNDSQQSNQSQASLSLSLPPPMGSVGSSTAQEAASTFVQQQQQQHPSGINNGGLLLAAAGSASTTPNASGTGDVNNHRLGGAPPVAGNKENANPVDYVLRRPRNCALLNTYKPTHKLANNHFHRYTDVKPRDERRATVIDLANQPNVQKKISGWKIHHLRSQMEDLNDSEMVSLSQLETMLKVLEKDKDKLGEIERISELLKGNIQRSKIITDGINEAQNQLMKIFDHQPHVSDIINRLQSKRNFKKREKL
ncbi:pneumococcal serine-rich repeat protein isoform X2 [Drosophila mojavensis]|uniref:pneumococcal serine-rich repeat protein isoform X2 n=1 Tax=Drosophila mojavensis TaxID=7230 RepID=UPI001CD145A8|nr:pneumococcal serine-rich repeat protein isoform X2 [Drosophila mojavensis]